MDKISIDNHSKSHILYLSEKVKQNKGVYQMAKKAVSSKANVVEYNKESLSLINDLCSITESIIIDKEGSDLLIIRSNNAKSVAYRLRLPANSFNVEGDTIGFYKFPEFYQLVSCFNAPNIVQSSDNKLTIEKDKSKINYLLSDVESLTKGPKKINFVDPEAKFEITSSDLKELKKMIGLLTAKFIKISCSKKNVNLTLYNSTHDNSFDKVYEGESSQDFEFPIASDIFTVIPEGDYIIEIMQAGMVRFSLKRENVSLEIFTAEVDE